MNGMTTEGPTRYAAVVGMGITGSAIAAYLPENYKVVNDETEPYFEGEVIIEGKDAAGWTLDGYVIPRLASGLFIAREQFLHIEDVGDGESGPRVSTWLEDEPMGRRAQAIDLLVRSGDPTQEAPRVRAPLTQIEKHELQHRRVAEAEDAFDTRPAPRRTGAERAHQRELEKKRWWALTGHLRSMHGIRGQAPFLRKTYEEVVQWHDRLHLEMEPEPVNERRTP